MSILSLALEALFDGQRRIACSLGVVSNFLAPQARPPNALRHVMLLLAVSVTARYSNLIDYFYHRVRKYAEEAEMVGRGQKVQHVPDLQDKRLIAVKEFNTMHFPRAWLRTRRVIDQHI